MEKTHDMNYSPHPMDHLVFLSILFLNYLAVKFYVAGFTDVLELVLLIPLKILPFVTAYLAYRKQLHETFKDIKAWFRRKRK